MFDIDKIFITMKHYRRIVDKERSTKDDVHHITTDVFDETENPEEYWCNKLIDNYLALLKDKRVFNQLNGPIDSDTELLTSIVDDLEEGNNKNAIGAYATSTLSAQADVKDKFVTGKTGIGPFALNNNSHILTMLYGVKFKEGYSEILSRLGLTDLSSSSDRDGQSIMSWLSGLINLHVDVAKDPKIDKLNINSYTYNLINMLIRTGLGKTTFYFTTQPIMRMLASVYNTASGVYMIEEGLTKSLAQRKYISDAIVQYVYANTGKSYEGKDKAIEEFKSQFKVSHLISVEDAIDRLFEKDCSVLFDISKGGSVSDLQNKRYELYTLKEGIQLSFYEVQMLVIIANEDFADPAKKLSDLVKYSKIDTKKQGKNVPEVEVYKKGVFRTFESAESEYVFENINNLYTGSYIKTKTDNAINMFERILATLSISATEQFNAIVQNIQRPLSAKDWEAMSVKTQSKIIKAVLALVKARFFFDRENGYCKTEGIGIKQLIDGKNSIYNRLLRIKAQIMSQPEYADYRDNSGNPVNYLLQVLISGYASDTKQGRFENAKFIEIPSVTQSDEIDPQEIITAWDSLLHDNLHPELKEFARDLVVYAFLTSGDNGGNKDLFKYVPNSWRFESGYAEYMKDVLHKFLNGTYEWTDSDNRDVILNNTDESVLVPVVKTDKVTVLTSSAGIPLVLTGVKIDSNLQPVVKFTYPSIVDAPPYVKTVYTDADTKQKTEYTYAKTNEGIINGITYPIYTLVNPRSTRFKRGNYVYGYGTRIEVDPAVNSAEFLTRVVLQMGIVKTTIDADNQITSAAQRNMELAIYESVLREKLVRKAEIAPTSSKKSVWVKSQSHYDRLLVLNDEQTLYIFTDNTDRTSGGQLYGDGWYKEKYGSGGFGSLNNPTTAQIRGLENAAPISTMRYFYKLHEGMTVADARWKDSDIEEFKRVIDSEIEDIKKLWDSGRFTKIVSPAGDGFFNSSIAQISKDSEIGKYLNLKLRELYDYVNGVRNNTSNINTIRRLSEVEEQLGRKIITPSNAPFVTEQLLLSVSGKQYDQQTLNRFLRVQNQIVDILYGKDISINQYTSITYANWKRMLLINYDIFGEKYTNQFETFVENDLLPVLRDGDFVNENDERYHDYNKKNKLITIPLIEYELINLLSNNPDYLLFLNQLSLESSLEDILTIVQDKYENVGDMVVSVATTIFEEGFTDQITEDVQESLEERNININFSYTDSRQLEFDFDDSDQSAETMNRCKGI